MWLIKKLYGRNSIIVIPKIIHYVWVGSTKVPKNITDNFLNTWKENNPTYKIIRWDESNIDFSNKYINNAYKHKNWANVSNLIRLQAVYKYGGFYFDTDVKIIRSLDPLRNNNCFFGFQLKEHPTDWVNNCTFGAIPGHWFVKKAMDYLENVYDGTEKANYSSPRMITELLKREGLSIYKDKKFLLHDIALYPVRYFYPFSWTEKYSENVITKDTFSVHFWEQRWN